MPNLAIRLTPAEHATLEQRAHAANQTKSDYVRDRLDLTGPSLADRVTLLESGLQDLKRRLASYRD